MDLFRRFMVELEPFEGEDTPAYEARVRRFANQYGCLGVGEPVRLPDGRLTHGETANAWWQAWGPLRTAIEVWEALRTEDMEILRRWFTWKDGKDFRDGIYTPETPWSSTVPQRPVQVLTDDAAEDHMQRWGISYNPDPTDRVSDWPSDPAWWGLMRLKMWVNTQLEAYTRPRLRYVPSSPEKTPLQLGIVPIRLLGEMWLQFAEELEGKLRYERCATCGRWFPVKPKGNRPSTRFCQPYCRVKGNRQTRKAKAVAKR